MTVLTPVTRGVLAVRIGLGILALALVLLWWPWSVLIATALLLFWSGNKLLTVLRNQLPDLLLFNLLGLLIVGTGVWLAFGADLLRKIWVGLPTPFLVTLSATVIIVAGLSWLIHQHKYLMPLFWTVPQEWQQLQFQGEEEAQATTDEPPIPYGKERKFQTFLRAVLGGARNWTRADGMQAGFTRLEWEAIDGWFRGYSLSTFKGGLTGEGKRYARDWLSQYYQDVEKIGQQ